MSVRWKGDAETGDLSQWASHVEFVPDRLRAVNASSPGGIAPFQGNYCYRFEVRNGEDTPGDNSTNQRAELGQGNPGNGPRFVAGQEDWIGLAIYFPTAFPKANWQTIAQFKNDGANPPPGGMSCNNDVISFDMGGSAKNLPGNGGILFRTPLVRNVWHTFKFHILWSETSSGFVEMWYDGTKVLNKTQTANLFPGIKNHARIGFYRAAAIAGTGVLYHDAYIVATTEAEVDAQLAGQDPGTVTPGGGGTTPTPVVVAGPLDLPTETAWAEAQATKTRNAIAVSAYPHYTTAAGAWNTTTAANWTSGFLPALYWRLFERTANTTWRDAAINAQAGVEGQKATANGDLGFQMLPFMRGYELTNTTAYRDVALAAATSLATRWDPEVGALRSWNSGVNGITNFNTIIDSMMNLELLFWAARNGASDASTLYSRALSHAQKVQAQHIRPDGSTYHVVEWNDTTGAMISRHTVQGFADSSAWARGQAWAIAGFTMAYRETRVANPTEAATFLTTAKAVAGYFVNNLPTTHVPLWDFQAPATDSEDSSAAAIAAYGLLELATFDTTLDWRTPAKQIMEALGANYHAPNAWYSILEHGTSAHPQGVGIDVGLIYGDHYYVEGLKRYADAGAGTTRALNFLQEAFTGTGPEFPTRSGIVAVANSQLQLSISSTIAASTARTAEDLVVPGKGVIAGPITWPTWVSGSGEVQSYLTVDLGNLNRFVLRRRTTYAGSSTATADQVEARLVTADNDPLPAISNWSVLPNAGSLQYLKIGFLTNGDVGYYVSTDGSGFSPVTTRTPASTTVLTDPAFVEVGLKRASGDVVSSTLAVGNVTGTNTPGGTSGTGLVKSDTSLHFDGTHIRVFPLSPGTSVSYLVVSKPANASKVMVPAGLSKGGTPLIDTFTRADATANLGTATPGGGTYLGAGGTIPSIASNAARADASVTNARAIYNVSMGSADNGVGFTLTQKPPNPAAKLFNWLIMLARITGSTTTTTGYVCAPALNTDGTVGFYFEKIINGSLQAALAGSPSTGIAFGVGDSAFFRVIGSTLEVWKKIGSAAWTLIGSITDTTYTTGNFVGFGAQASGTNPTSVDNLLGGTFTSTSNPVPPDRSGRALKITTGRVPEFWDNTLTPAAEFGAGTMPATPAWSMVLVGRKASSGVVAARVWDGTSFVESENVATVSAGATISDTAARFVIGDREPGAVTDQSFIGDVAAVAGLSDEPGATAFEGLVSNGVVNSAALTTLPNVVRAYDLTQMAAPTDQILDLVGTAHEITAERVGTGTIATDTGNVPVGTGGTAPTPPASAAWAPGATGMIASNPHVTAGTNPVTGEVTLTVDATATVAASGSRPAYTPHATPYEFLTSDDGVSWTSLGGFQATNTKLVTGITPGFPHLYTAHYRDNSATPVVGELASPITVQINEGAASGVPSRVTGAVVVRNNGGLLDVYWDPNPTVDAVTEYDVYLTAGYNADEDPQPAFSLVPVFAGAGSTVAGGTVVTDARGLSYSVGGKLKATQITGLSDTLDYGVKVEAHRPS